MASGDLTASTPTLTSTAAEIKSAVDGLNLAATTDMLYVVNMNNGQHYVFKVEREA